MQELNLILERIRTMVDESGLSYVSIAASCGVSEKTVSRVLHDTDPGKNPSFLLLCGIITACGGSVDEVIGNAQAGGQRIVVSDSALVSELHSEVRHERNKVRLWSTLFVVLALAVILVFAYDAFNPHIGWIRYATQSSFYSADTASAEMLGRIVSWVTGHAV